MTTNRTSEAVEYYLADFSPDGIEQTTSCPKNELWAIAEKYKRMEEALRDITEMAFSEQERYPILGWYRREADKALDFDPLPPQS